MTTRMVSRPPHPVREGQNLTYREVGPKHGFSRATVGRLIPLVRLAPGIQEAVSRLTTTAQQAAGRGDQEMKTMGEAMMEELSNYCTGK